MTHTTLQVQELDGEFFIELTDEMVKFLDVKIGDTILWTDNKDGSFTMTKKQQQKTVLVLVEAIQSFRMRYVVEVPADHPEYALDTVATQDAKEFSQQALPEITVSHRIVTKKEALRILDEDEPAYSGWIDKKKIETFFTPWVEPK